MLECKLFIRKNRKNRNLYMAVFAHQSKLGDISTGLFCKPNQWQGNRWCKVEGKMDEADRKQNKRVNQSIQELIESYQIAWDSLLGLGQKAITLNDLKNVIDGTHIRLGEKPKRIKYSEACEIFFEARRESWADPGSVKSSLNMGARLMDELKLGDITLDQYSMRVAKQVMDLMVQRGYAHGTRVQLRSIFKQVFDYFFVNKDMLDFNPVLPEMHPWLLVKAKMSKEERKAKKSNRVHYYSDAEIFDIEDIQLDDIKLDYFRKVHLFQIYSGLSFSDVQRFNPSEHIITDMDGMRWISYSRKKTHVEFFIPVTEKLDELIKFFNESDYKAQTRTRKLGWLQIGSDAQNYIYLNVISQLLGFKITCTHKARHTFAMQQVNKGLWHYEDVAAMLGHANPATTAKTYAHVNMDRLAEKIKRRKDDNDSKTVKMTGTE